MSKDNNMVDDLDDNERVIIFTVFNSLIYGGSKVSDLTLRHTYRKVYVKDTPWSFSSSAIEQHCLCVLISCVHMSSAIHRLQVVVTHLQSWQCASKGNGEISLKITLEMIHGEGNGFTATHNLFR